MKNKALLLAGALLIAITCFGAGVATTSYGFLFMELNDRLKYEVAYLNGYISTQKRIKSGDIAKAEKSIDFLIDAHVHTLYEFNYMTSSLLFTDIGEVLCKAVALRKQYPVVREGTGPEISLFYEEVDSFLMSDNWEC